MLKLLIPALSLSLLLSSTPAPVGACGPFFDQAQFSLTLHPDAPLRLFAEGQMGVLPPSYARSYQLVAYRYFSGKPLSKDEIDGITRLWKTRINPDGGKSYEDKTPLWLKARAQVKGLKAVTMDDSSNYRNIDDPDSWYQYLNCGPDALATAAATLDSRIGTYGADSNIVRDWVLAQDSVFCHCASPSMDYKTNKRAPEPPFPQPAGADAPLGVKQDRAYQIAAAHFYAAKFDQAKSLFEAIARDSSSPWHKTAAYMVARCLIRKGTLANPKGLELGYLKEALQYLDKLPADVVTDFRRSIEDLKRFIAVRLDQDGSFLALGRRLSGEERAGNTYNDLDDYTYILDRFFNEADDTSEKHEIKDAKYVTIVQKEDMSDWIYCYTADVPVDHVRHMYKTTKSLPWLICLASKLKVSDPDLAHVMTELSKVDKKSPAYLTALYYQVKILLDEGKIDKARALLDEPLGAIPPSAQAALGVLKVQTARNLDELIKFSFISPAAILSGDDGCENQDFDALDKAGHFKYLKPMLWPDSAAFINTKLKLDSFLKVAASPYVSSQKADFAQAAFTRAFLLGDFARASGFLPAIASGYPSSGAGSIAAGNRDEEKKFAYAFFLLKNPGSRPYVTGGVARVTAFNRIDDYQDNWWAADFSSVAGDKPVKSNLAENAGADLSKIKGLGDGPAYLGRIVVAYAKTHPADKRVPEALHLVARAPKFSGGDASTSKVSAEAFNILHKNYKGNPWTAKTPYHY